MFIIGVLIVFVLLQNKGCVGGGEKPTSDTLVVHDTTWVQKDSLIYAKPLPAKIIYDSLYLEGKIQYLADTNYATLKVQFDNLVKLYTALAIYVDSVKLDTLGYVVVGNLDFSRDDFLLQRFRFFQNFGGNQSLVKLIE